MERLKHVENEGKGMPILIPVEQEIFWRQVRMIVREEVERLKSAVKVEPSYDVPGMVQKPLYKIQEICGMFQISKPTVYEWCKQGKLRPMKIQSRVFFLWEDIRRLISTGS